MRRWALLAYMLSASALADSSCEQLASLGQAASDAYLTRRPTTERIYQVAMPPEQHPLFSRSPGEPDQIERGSTLAVEKLSATRLLN